MRVEQALQAQPASAALHYLAGVACLQLQLWGKAQQFFKQAQPRLSDPKLMQRCWQKQAELAQRQGDNDAAAAAWKKAATSR